jgi:hypothetical protein
MSDFSVYLATEIVEWMSQNTQLDTPPSSLYVTVFDSGGTEQGTNFPNGRVEVAAPGDWAANGTDFENDVNIDFGEAPSDVTDLTDVALFDAATGGNELARYQMTDAPFDVSAGSNLIFLIGELSFNVIDRTE